MLDMREACSFVDYFVICSGSSEKQLQAIFDEIAETLKKRGVLPHHHEGAAASVWLLLDYGDVIVHVFGTFEREYYQLDKLWSNARVVLRMQ